MPLTFTQPGWVSAGGLLFLVPGGWQDTSEVTFVVSAPTKQYLVWGLEGYTADGALQALEKQRSKTLQSGLAKVVTELESLPHERWQIFTYNALAGTEPGSVAYAHFAIVRPYDTLTLRCRTSVAQVPEVRQALLSVWPRQLGSRPVPGRYSVFDVSFAWPVPLAFPHEFSFEAKDHSATLLLNWYGQRPEFYEPTWEKIFAYEPTAQVQLQQRAMGPVQSGMIPCPFPTHPQKLVFEQATWSALAVAGAQQQPLTVQQARAAVGQSYLWLEFRSQIPEALAIWQHTLASLHVELQA